MPRATPRGLNTARPSKAPARRPPGRTPEEALSNVNEIVRMIVQECIEDGKSLPEGPAESVEVFEISPEEPRIAVTV